MLKDLGKKKTVIDGKTITYVLKRSPRAKYVRLEVRPDSGLTIVIPKSYDPDLIPDLLKKKEKWISGKLEKYSNAPEPGSGRELKTGDILPYLGRNVEVVIRLTGRNIERVRLEGNRLVFYRAALGSRTVLMLERWYREQAARLITEKAEKYSDLMGLKYNRLTIRGQKTRWGSCSYKRNLSFNWKLMIVPEPVVDYVIIHELTHLREMNHSQKFWKLVEQHCPGWRKHRKWLDSHTGELVPPLFSR